METINVGGTLFTCLRSTLTKYDNSFLTGIINSGNPMRDKDGNIFIDADPHNFREILNYLRRGVITLNDSIVADLDYFCIPHDDHDKIENNFRPSPLSEKALKLPGDSKIKKFFEKEKIIGEYHINYSHNKPNATAAFLSSNTNLCVINYYQYDPISIYEDRSLIIEKNTPMKRTNLEKFNLFWRVKFNRNYDPQKPESDVADFVLYFELLMTSLKTVTKNHHREK